MGLPNADVLVSILDAHQTGRITRSAAVSDLHKLDFRGLTPREALNLLTVTLASGVQSGQNPLPPAQAELFSKPSTTTETKKTSKARYPELTSEPDWWA